MEANWPLAAGQYSEWPAVQIGGKRYNVYLDGTGNQTNVLNFEAK